MLVQEYAVKQVAYVCDEDETQTMKEVRMLGRVRHENIVRLYSYDHRPQQRQLYLVLELCEGGSLDDLVKHHRRNK